MEDSCNRSGTCKLGTPTKCSSSMTLNHANPFTKLLQDINDQSTIEKSWNCSLLCNGYLPIPTNDGPSTHDLTFHMDSNNTFMYEFPLKRRSSFMFDPNEFSGVKDVRKIALHVKQLCRDNGFDINVKKTYKQGKELIKHFSCKHNRAPEEFSSNTAEFHGDSLQQAGTKTQTMKRKKTRSQNRSKDGKTTNVCIPTKRKTRSFAPMSEACRCQFHFKIFCIDDGNWYLGKNNPEMNVSHFHHIGHVKTNPELLSISHTELTDAQLNLVANCVELGLSDSIISKLLSREVKMDGILSREQIKYVRMKHEAEQIVADHQKDSHLTSAEKLLNKFSNLVSRGEEIYYCALILDRHGEYLIRLPPGRPRKNQKKDIGDPNIPTCSANCEYKHKKSIILSCFVTLCLITKQFVSI